MVNDGVDGWAHVRRAASGGMGPERLLPESRTAWAKHDAKTDDWMPLWRHMADSAAVAGLLWDRWLPSHVRALISDALPEGQRDGRRLSVWLAGVHDIGKATPAFACQVDGLADRMRAAGLDMPSRQMMGPDRKMAPHGLAGQLLLQEWLEEGQGWTGRAIGQFAVVVGGHHGVPPDFAQIDDLDRHLELLRTPGPSDPVWRRVQTDLLEAAADAFGVRGRLDAWQGVKLPQPAQVLLTALVIVADWIASNPDLFPYTQADRSRADDERVAAGWRGLGLPAPWSPEEPLGPVEELFRDRFELPPGTAPRPVQTAAVDLARSMSAPGLMIIEAPMGEGKTEAALAVAEIFAARAGAGGCFFALPTMATSNAMFARLHSWLDRLPAREGDRLSVLLAHSKAALNEDYSDLLRASWQPITAIDLDDEQTSHPAGGGEQRESPAGGGQQRESSAGGGERRRSAADLVAHHWLRGRKKGMLSSFVAGTIDQLLLAGLKSRHLALRHLALAGKVVVIDEAHAFDTYMNSYLDRVLTWLGAYRVPVVVLSATLPAARRRALAEAYAGAPAGAEAFAGVQGADDYPLLTAVAAGGAPRSVAPQASGRRTEVIVERIADDVDALADRLARELDDGGSALVVRNTVDRVLEAAAALRARFGEGEVTVAHARFLDPDRARKDAELLARFGPPDSAGHARPTRHVVVASQVVEQSLDIDFDLLVTDLAPVDLVLQRMGRLHRHARGPDQNERPERLRTARCLLTGADWGTSPPEPVRGSKRIYGAHTLLRSAAALAPHLDEARGPVRLPHDINPLVQRAYGADPLGPAEWAEPMAKARRAHDDLQACKRRCAAAFQLDAACRAGRPLIGWLARGVGDADDTRAGLAQVRDSEESLEVLVVQRRPDGSLATVDWLAKGLGGLPLPTDAVPNAEAAKAAAMCGLRLPWHFSRPETIGKAIAELESTYFEAWQGKECHWLAGQLVLVLDADRHASLAGHHLDYSDSEGLRVHRD